MSISQYDQSSGARYLEGLQERLLPFLGTTDPEAEPNSEIPEALLEELADAMGIERSHIDQVHKESRDKALAERPTRYEDPGWFSVVKELADELDEAANVLGMKLPPIPVFGTLPLKQVNAMAVPVPHADECIIVFQVGLFGFMNLASKAFAAALPVDTDGNGATFSVDPETVRAHLRSDGAPVRRMGELLEAYVCHGDPHVAEQYLMGNPGLAVANIFRRTAEQFVLAHEYGHLIGGHLAIERAAAGSPAMAEVHGIPQDWQQEYEADFLGTLLTAQANASKGFDLALAYAGVDLAFTAIALVERAVALSTTGDAERRASTDSHPPATSRRHTMRLALESLTDDEKQVEGARGLAEALEQIGDMFWAEIAPRFEQIHLGAATPAAIWDVPGKER